MARGDLGDLIARGDLGVLMASGDQGGRAAW